ncbi:MAG TPA: hypothetical protein VEC17_02905 [Candidatus Binatia bacterium]|nr:hypothetical protein [Candidatus Binatia bacterium]
MKKLLFIAMLLVLPAMAAQAHEVKHSGSLSILLHMEPLDDPAAGEQGQLYFSVEDSNNKFKVSDCDCQVIVELAGQELLNRKVTPEDEAPDWGANVMRIPFVFPSRNIYQVSIIGKSKTNSFADFTLEYDKRIERESVTQPHTQKTGEEDSNFLTNYYAIGGGIIILGIIVYEVNNRLRKKNK